MELIVLFAKTVLLRPYVLIFLATFLFAAIQLIGWPRTWRFWLISWATAFACEYSSTRTGIPFGWYHYNGSTVGEELYLSNIPLMDSISFSFLLYAAYSVALCFLLPSQRDSSSSLLLPLRFDKDVRTSWQALLLTVVFYAVIDMVIDPVALRGDRWFLGKIYYYPDPGTHFGVPVANYVGWAVVGLISLSFYFPLDRRLPALPPFPGDGGTRKLLLGVGLYYSVLTFNLAIAFWIDERLLGISGILTFLLPTAVLLLRLTTRSLVAFPDRCMGPKDFVYLYGRETNIMKTMFVMPARTRGLETCQGDLPVVIVNPSAPVGMGDVKTNTDRPGDRRMHERAHARS